MTNSTTQEASILLRLDKLKLHNYRCFTECSIDLHPKLTVFVAENAQGKTAILDALGIALDVFVTTIVAGKKSHGFDLSSVHLIREGGSTMVPMLPTEFHAEGYIDSKPVKWSRALKNYSPYAHNTTKNIKEICALTNHLCSLSISSASDGAGSQPLLPIAAFYGTGRLWSEYRFTDRKKVINPGLSRFSAYLDCLASSSSFRSFVSWYEKAFTDLRNPTSKTRGSEERLDRQIAAVEEAVRTALEPTGWQSISWNFPVKDIDGRPQGTGHIVVDHPDHGRFPLSLLSDGVKNMVALVADLAYRCVRLNSHLGESAARETPGIVLIDEIDMHLHPRWQQLVVELLQKAFPSMQMILTTHSPQVLSTVKAESIRLIRLDNGIGIISTPRFQTRGVESADVLSTIMGVDPIPQVEESKWLNDYQALIETGKHTSPDGLALRTKLINHFAADHPLMLDCERLVRFQDFKRRKP